jgi:Protein of unknown function (DUF2510)
MPVAAWCSECQANVWVSPEGACPNGHLRSSLRGLHEVVSPPVAGPGNAGAPPPKTRPAYPVSATMASAGWRPDSMGRHELRYWDGASWTEHVVDAGSQSRDPLAGARVLSSAQDRQAATSSGQVVQPTPDPQVSPATVAQAASAAWYLDPSGRHQLRYWDGAAWSPYVSDRGVQFVDARPAQTPGPPVLLVIMAVLLGLCFMSFSASRLSVIRLYANSPWAVGILVRDIACTIGWFTCAVGLLTRRSWAAPLGTVVSGLISVSSLILIGQGLGQAGAWVSGLLFAVVFAAAAVMFYRQSLGVAHRECAADGGMFACEPHDVPRRVFKRRPLSVAIVFVDAGLLFVASAVLFVAVPLAVICFIAACGYVYRGIWSIRVPYVSVHQDRVIIRSAPAHSTHYSVGLGGLREIRPQRPGRIRLNLVNGDALVLRTWWVRPAEKRELVQELRKLIAPLMQSDNGNPGARTR